MDRFTEYNKGMTVVNQDLDNGGYNYYAQQRWGRAEYCIIKEKTDFTEYSYYIGTDGYAAAWAAHTELIYKTPNNLKTRQF